MSPEYLLEILEGTGAEVIAVSTPVILVHPTEFSLVRPASAHDFRNQDKIPEPFVHKTLISERSTRKLFREKFAGKKLYVFYQPEWEKERGWRPDGTRDGDRLLWLRYREWISAVSINT